MNFENKQQEWHTLDIKEIRAAFALPEKGLGAEEAASRLTDAGSNTLTAEEGTGPLRLFLRQVNSPLIYLLIIAAVFSAVVGHEVDALVIAGVIILNSLLGFFQEWRAEGAIDALRRMASLNARVLRDGTIQEIDAADVVPGDVLVLETGDQVSADARLVETGELQIDESALTGESLPVVKNVQTLERDIPVSDRKNMVWMSTNVTGGRGRAVVTATGMSTQMGQIAAQVRAVGRTDTPLQKRMNKLSLFLGIGGVVFAAGVFGMGLLRGYQLIEMLMFAVAVAVSAIPEGLPAVISVTLAMGVRRMAARNAIVRRMSAVETLGSTTVICTDKTGTLTENQMTVQTIWAGNRTWEVSGDGYRPEGAFFAPDGKEVDTLSDDLKLILEIGLICNNTEIQEEDGKWGVRGNPSEGALLTAAKKAGMDKNTAMAGTRLSEIPFSSESKYMATLHEAKGDSRQIAYVKGAPERVLGFCSHALIEGKTVILDDPLRKKITNKIEEFGSQAFRVMAGAIKENQGSVMDMDRGFVESGLTLAGLWGIIDPPREESAIAVRDAKDAGIHPVMITGDHAITALAIARAVGINSNGNAVIGSDIDTMEKPALARAAMENGVFARVSPSHKLKIMEALKEQGEVVAMTGDGVNDAPALKGADIGVAMGRTGTDVAKEAADMILTDDNFATIVHAVEEGRTIFANLRHVVFFLLATNLGEILVLAAALVIGLDLPLTAVMILWVNLVTDGACTVPLGMEPGHKGILKRPPKNPKESIINRGMLLRMALLTPFMVAGTTGLFWYFLGTESLAYARTIAFTTLVAFQWFQAFNARSSSSSVFSVGLLSNKWVLIGVGAAVLLQILAVHTFPGQLLFGTTSLQLIHWLLIVLVASSIWIADELFKLTGIYGKTVQKK